MSEKAKRIFKQCFFIVADILIIAWAFLFLTLNLISVSGTINGASVTLSLSGYQWIFNSQEVLTQNGWQTGGFSGALCLGLIALCSVYAAGGILETDAAKKARKTEKALAILFVVCVLFFAYGAFLAHTAGQEQWVASSRSYALVAPLVSTVLIVVYFALKQALRDDEDEVTQVVTEDGKTVLKIRKSKQIKTLGKATKTLLKYKNLLDDEVITLEEYEKIKDALLP